MQVDLTLVVLSAERDHRIMLMKLSRQLVLMHKPDTPKSCLPSDTIMSYELMTNLYCARLV